MTKDQIQQYSGMEKHIGYGIAIQKWYDFQIKGNIVINLNRDTHRESANQIISDRRLQSHSETYIVRIEASQQLHGSESARGR